MIGHPGSQCLTTVSKEYSRGLRADIANKSSSIFKLIPEVGFEHIEKQVHRERCKREEERVWTWFVEQKMQDLQVAQDAQCGTHRVKQLLDLTNLEGIRQSSEATNKFADVGLEELSDVKANGENWIGEDDEEMIESPKVVKDSRVVKKSHSDPGVNLCRKGYTKQLPRAVHTGKGKQVCGGRPLLQNKKYSEDGMKHEGRCKSGSENESDVEIRRLRRDITRQIQLDQSTINRIETVRQKILLLLDQIACRFSQIPVPDGENDLRRRQRRAMEFAVRFSRNYLYDLNRLVTRLQRNVGAIKRLKARYNQCSRAQCIVDNELIERELVTAHQLLLNAITAYSNHIPSAVLINPTARLTELLFKLAVDLTEVFDELQLSHCRLGSGDTNVLQVGRNNELRCKCEAILAKLEEEWTVRAVQMKSTCNQRMPHDAAVSGNDRKAWNRTGYSNRLSMYSGAELGTGKSSRKQRHRAPAIFRSSANKTEKLGNERCTCAPASALPSKFPRSHRDLHVSSAKPSYPLNQRSSVSHRTVSTDEEAKKSEFATMITTTLMSTDSERAASSVIELPPNVKKSTVDGRKTSGRSSKESSLVTSNSPATNDDEDDSRKSYRQCSRPTRGGFESNPRNVKSTDAVTYKDEFDTVVGMKEQRNVCDASCQASCESHSMKTIDTCNAYPDPREKRTVLMLSERTEKSFSEYRWYYQQQCRSRPMYSDSTRNKPWDIVSWISDKLVEELLVEVAKELQINSVIRKMFELEFRDF